MFMTIAINGSQRNFFLPVCLYATTKYRQKSFFENLLMNLTANYKNGLILVCDEARVFDLLITGKCINENEARAKATADGKNILRMIENLLSGHNYRQLSLSNWNAVSSSPRYAELEESIVKALANDAEFSEVFESYARALLRKLRRPKAVDIFNYEMRYLLNEVVMSIYVSEILGFPDEIWEVKAIEKPIDPITFLYEDKKILVSEWIGKSVLRRNQLSLQDIC